jgi:hypothetical protein
MRHPEDDFVESFCGTSMELCRLTWKLIDRRPDKFVDTNDKFFLFATRNRHASLAAGGVTLVANVSGRSIFSHFSDYHELLIFKKFRIERFFAFRTKTMGKVYFREISFEFDFYIIKLQH